MVRRHALRDCVREPGERIRQGLQRGPRVPSTWRKRAGGIAVQGRWRLSGAMFSRREQPETTARAKPSPAGTRRPLSLALVIFGVAARLLPHPPNLTPVGASALFAGARLRGWQAFLVPLLAMVASDPLLASLYGFRAFSRGTIFIYGSFLVNVAIGRCLRNTEHPGRIAAAALACSVQ